MHCNNLRLVLWLGLVRVSSRVRVRIRVKVRVSVMVRVSIRTRWVANFALFRCYRPVIYTRPRTGLPFPQIDIIGAMVIVWRVRGKIIRSVLCNIACNNCAQCNARTYEQT